MPAGVTVKTRASLGNQGGLFCAYPLNHSLARKEHYEDSHYNKAFDQEITFIFLLNWMLAL